MLILIIVEEIMARVSSWWIYNWQSLCSSILSYFIDYF